MSTAAVINDTDGDKVDILHLSQELVPVRNGDIGNYAQTLHENFRGKLHLRIGPMSAGKTTDLITEYSRIEHQRIPCIILRSVLDTRSASKTVQSMSGASKPCVPCQRLTNRVEFLDYLVKNVQVIFLDEAQFFDEDLVDFCLRMVDTHHKCVYVYALNGDSDRRLFGHVYKLLPHVSSIAMFTGYCATCQRGQHGVFSACLVEKTGQYMVGTQGEQYVTQCRACYNKRTSFK